MKIELSDGGWADIRDPRKLTERQMEAVEDAQFELMQNPAVQEILNSRGNDGFEQLQELDGAQVAMKIGVPGLKWKLSKKPVIWEISRQVSGSMAIWR